MAERATFPSSAYSAYYHREHPPADNELTRVSPGTFSSAFLPARDPVERAWPSRRRTPPK